MFFFEKKTQKTFAGADADQPAPPAHVSKVFCFFFSKKKRSLA
jgi:hypothetical protein